MNVVSVQRVSPNFAVCNLSNGETFEVRGSAEYVNTRTAELLAGAPIPVTSRLQYVANNSVPILKPAIDPELLEPPYVQPTMNFTKPAIVQANTPGAPHVEYPPSVPMFYGSQNRSDDPELNEPPYVQPKMDFGRRA